jgi:signal transduction histidine kinase
LTFYKKLWPQSLYWQLIAAVAVGVIFVQGISAFGGYYTQNQMAQTQAAFMLRERVLNVAERLEDSGKGWDAVSRPSKDKRNGQISILLSDNALTLSDFTQDAALTDAAQQSLMGASLGGLDNVSVSIGPVSALPAALSGPPLRSRFVRRLRNQGLGTPTQAIILTAQTDDGRWVNSASLIRPAGKWSLIWQFIKAFAIFAAVMLPLALVARRIVRPLERLTARAAHVGIMDAGEPIESKGPVDIRNLINSFNSMQARVTSLLSEKDVMLGAIGHDLKTPLASLRVRVETVEDETERQKMADTIDEMAIMLDDILTLARLGKSGEAVQLTDIGALLETVTQDFEEQEAQITYVPAEARIVANIRPVLIRRALRNLAANAVKHGGNAELSVEKSADKVMIIIDDNGPGIAAEQIDDMFTPFVRAEASRNRSTGGSGLGLTIARAIARSHGGDVTLSNRIGGGLRAVMTIAA